MEFNIIPDKEAMSKCAWCHNHISDGMEVFGAGAKLKPDADLSEYESHCIQIELVSESYLVVNCVYSVFVCVASSLSNTTDSYSSFIIITFL